MSEPKLGIFWYDEINHKLIGVYSQPESQIKEDYKGVRVFPVLHVEVWEELYNKYHNKYGEYIPDEEYPNERTSIFNVRDYTQIPRGRIFSDNYGYQIYVGNWINKHKNVVDLILKEFNLPEDETQIVLDEHWNIGHGWGE